MQGLGDRCGRQPGEARRRGGIEAVRQAFAPNGTPGYFDPIPKTPDHDVREQSALPRGLKPMTHPPVLPCTLPLGSLFLVVFDSGWREPGSVQGRPSGIVSDLDRKAFFVKQRIPATDEPFEKRKKIPVGRIDSLTFFQMGTQIPAFHPDLEASPGETDLGIDGSAFVRIGGEGHSDGEHARIAREPFPPSGHVRLLLPMFPDIPPLHPAFPEPFATELFRDLFPSDRVAVPDVVTVMLCTVRPACVGSVPLAAFRIAGREQLLRDRPINLPWAKRSPPTPLPRLLVLGTALVVHCVPSRRRDGPCFDATYPTPRRPLPRRTRRPVELEM